jgi:hypothetical protein
VLLATGITAQPICIFLLYVLTLLHNSPPTVYFSQSSEVTFWVLSSSFICNRRVIKTTVGFSFNLEGKLYFLLKSITGCK